MTRFRAVLAVAAGSLLLAAPTLQAQPNGWIDSGSRRVALVELYTSEGCSSCPPAEAWVARLRAHPQLWRAFVPVNFHVDYWDRLGWKDRFASPLFTNRQYRWVQQLGLRSAYTPGFIVDGKEWRGFFASRDLPLQPDAEVGPLRVLPGEASAQLVFEPVEDPPVELEMRIVLIGFGLRSDVSAGENRGRRLEQNFVALGMNRGRAEKSGKVYRSTLPLPLKRAQWPKRAGLVAWVSAVGDPTPLQVVGADLPPQGAASAGL